MIVFESVPADLKPDRLKGFFSGWPDPPPPAVHLRLLRNSDAAILARDTGTDTIVGFITAISDGVLAAYIPLLEVIEDYRGRGIGTELLRRMLRHLRRLYMIDLVCDPETVPFYRAAGMAPGTAMVIRNRDRSSGARRA